MTMHLPVSVAEVAGLALEGVGYVRGLKHLPLNGLNKRDIGV
jgi:hypothetical protein